MPFSSYWLKWVPLVLAAVPASFGCKRSATANGTSASQVAQAIQNIGSDTMVNVAQAWAEEYATVERDVSIEVSGGGSGVGIAALINGTAHIANSSRQITPSELDKAKKASGSAPKEFLVGYDGLAVFVHRQNPVEQLSVEELADIFRESGPIDRWSQLGVRIPDAKTDKIIRVSRQNNSGTYQYFREVLLGKKGDFKQGSLDMNGSKEVVELVSKTPSVLGYSGLGYATSAVKVLKISKRKGGPAIAPTIATIQGKAYPISRPLYMYTPGEPTPLASKYLAWVMSAPGQEIVKNTGYIPLSL